MGQFYYFDGFIYPVNQTSIELGNLKRKFILIEKEQKYCKIAKNRIYGDLFYVDK